MAEIPEYRYEQEDVDKMGPKQVIGRLQDLIGYAIMTDHDRNPDRKQNVTEYLARAHDLCIKVRGRWKP